MLLFPNWIKQKKKNKTTNFLVPFYPKSLHKSRIVEGLDIGMLFNSSSKTLVLETRFYKSLLFKRRGCLNKHAVLAWLKWEPDLCLK